MSLPDFLQTLEKIKIAVDEIHRSRKEEPMNNIELNRLQRRIHIAMVELSRLQAMYRTVTGREYVISGPAPKPLLPATFRICIGSDENGIIDVCEKHRRPAFDSAKAVYRDQPFNKVMTISIDPDKYECQICADSEDAYREADNGGS